MRTIPIVRWIANAAARLVGSHGAVTQAARDTGCSRQCVYDHARKVNDAVEAEHGVGPTHAELLRELEQLRRENTQLCEWLDSSTEFPLSKQQEFAATGVAMGLSTSQVRDLMVIVQGPRISASRSTVHRWVQAAEKAAGHVLDVLDRSSRERVVAGCLDEIFFHGQPVLVGVDPHSMAWFLGKKSENHEGPTWFAELQPWSSLNYVTTDAGSGLKAGIAQLQRERRDTDQVPLIKALDVFHTKRAAQKALSVIWTRVEHAWHLAEAASRTLKRARWQGRSERRPTQQRDEAWKKAFCAFKHYERIEAVWDRVKAALDLFRPDGQLNDRIWAQEQVEWALSRLTGKEWSKVRGLLQSPESFTFLDRLHEQLNQLPLPEALRNALVRLWWLHRQLPRKSAETEVAGYSHAAYLVQKVLCSKLDSNWLESYRRIADIFRQTVRASSAVECMNSVLRMHQSRHRTITQPMLDLKRLYWNTRVFRAGKRKGRCPYQQLGLDLPSYNFWDLLHPRLQRAVPASETRATNQPRAA